jgi:hypothetical protein
MGVKNCAHFLLLGGNLGIDIEFKDFSINPRLLEILEWIAISLNARCYLLIQRSVYLWLYKDVFCVPGRLYRFIFYTEYNILGVKKV